MTLGDWDYLAIAGLIALTAGIWLTFGVGPMLIVLGVIVLLIGIGGATRPVRR